jgi:hypothetical protein
MLHRVPVELVVGVPERGLKKLGVDLRAIGRGTEIIGSLFPVVIQEKTYTVTDAGVTGEIYQRKAGDVPSIGLFLALLRCHLVRP